MAYLRWGPKTNERLMHSPCQHRNRVPLDATALAEQLRESRAASRGTHATGQNGRVAVAQYQCRSRRMSHAAFLQTQPENYPIHAPLELLTRLPMNSLAGIRFLL